MNTHGLFLSVKVLLQAFLLTGRADIPLCWAYVFVG